MDMVVACCPPCSAMCALSKACAIGLQMLSKAKKLGKGDVEPGILLKKADGADVVKKNSNRKGRALLLFSSKLTPIQGGKIVRSTSPDPNVILIAYAALGGVVDASRAATASEAS